MGLPDYLAERYNLPPDFVPPAPKTLTELWRGSATDWRESQPEAPKEWRGRPFVWPVQEAPQAPEVPSPQPAPENAASARPGASAGIKHDAGKVPLDLLPMRALTEVGKVLQFGAKKYAANNWRAGIQWSRLIAAALRHLFAFARGEDVDEETGLCHLAHASCCILFLLTYWLEEKNNLDDRYKEPA